jgi:RimJ/RimL family protein N-acetyltransferase
VHDNARLIGFAGSVPFDPCQHIGYLKRAAVIEEYRGKGIQRDLMRLREDRACASTDWTHLVSECSVENIASANNFIRSGFMLFEPERPWAKETLF